MSTPRYYQTNYNFSGTTTTTPPTTTDLGNNFVPVGTILLYAGTTLPANYLWCDGTQKSTTTYSTLYSVIGDTYNITTPSAGNFFLPNLSSSVPIGAGNTSNMQITYQGSSVKSGGNKNMQANQLATHTHTFPTGTTGYAAYVANDPGENVQTGPNGLFISFSPFTQTGENASSSQDFLPPFTVVNYIIKYQ